MFLDDETRYRRGVVKRLLVKVPMGRYDNAEWWRCQGCKNYYREALDACPLCQRPRTRGAARSTVWVLGQLPVDRSKKAEGKVVPNSREESFILQETIQKAIEQLPPLQQEVIGMVFWEQMPLDEIARKLRCSLAEVKDAHKAAMAQLKTFLGNEAFGHAM